jgi:hypothetical protein
MTDRRIVPALFLAAALAACGGGGDEATEAAQDASTPTPASSGVSNTGTAANDTTPHRPGSPDQP